MPLIQILWFDNKTVCKTTFIIQWRCHSGLNSLLQHAKVLQTVWYIGVISINKLHFMHHITSSVFCCCSHLLSLIQLRCFSKSQRRGYSMFVVSRFRITVWPYFLQNYEKCGDKFYIFAHDNEKFESRIVKFSKFPRKGRLNSAFLKKNQAVNFTADWKKEGGGAKLWSLPTNLIYGVPCFHASSLIDIDVTTKADTYLATSPSA